MDLSNSVIMPREDFQELTAVAYNQPPMTGKERAASVAHLTAICAGAAIAFTGAAWGWAKASDWLERRKLEREMALREPLRPHHK